MEKRTVVMIELYFSIKVILLIAGIAVVGVLAVLALYQKIKNK